MIFTSDEERREVDEKMRGYAKELDEITAGEEYDRMVEHLKSACATCVYSFPVAIGYSCGITKKVTSDVIVKCEAYKRASGRRRANE